MDGQLGSEEFRWAEVLARFEAVRSRTEAMVEELTEADCQVQSMADASPVKWHLAHTTWFWETFILKALAGVSTAPDDRWDFLFNSYYEAVGARHARPDRGLATRPRLKEVLRYRQCTTDAVMEFCSAEEVSPDKLLSLLEIGVAHEEQHQELILTDLKHAMSCNPLWPSVLRDADSPEPRASSQSSGQWLSFPGGLVEIGHRGSDFGFDNEYPRHKTWIEPFQLHSRLVTNADVVAFMDDGGYETASLWLSDGWTWVQSHQRTKPDYWRRDGHHVQVYTLAGPKTLDPEAPASHLSAYEANAIATYLGGRLPTEAEWEHAASGVGLAARPSCPAGTSPETRPLQGAGLQGLFGEVWQWTASAYTAYPGYRTALGAIGEYNGKFMSGQQVLRGSSCATSPGHARLSYRNFFYAPSTWQFSGLRLARDG